MPKASAFTYWYLHVASGFLLLVMVLLLARLLVALMAGNRSALGRLVVAITHPVVATVGAVTPRIVPPAGVVVCAIVWLVAARVVLFMVALAMGVRL